LEDAMAATMPENRIQQPLRTIADIPVGGEAIVEVFSVVVDLDRMCYLKATGKVIERAEGMLAVKVRRDRDGFHLYLNDNVPPFIPEAIDAERRSKLVPVTSIFG
jgi:hypothetical protein